MDFFTLMQSQLGFFLLIFVRISGVFIMAPIFGSRNITGRVKAGLALLITYILFPIVFNPTAVIPDHLLPYLFLVAGELLVGLILGFISSLIFTAIQMAGQLLDMQIGFGIVHMLDPMSGQQAPLIGNFKYILALLVFLATNGHHVLLSAIFASFKLIPVTGVVMHAEVTEFIINLISGMFILAFKISLPVIVSLILTDVALGILARTMPQMNIFVVGVPGKIIIGIFVLSIALPFYIFFWRWHLMGCIKIFSVSYPSCSGIQTRNLNTVENFDLQLFAGEKTEEATPKRKAEARKKGQVAKSMEINSVFVIVAAFFTLKIIGSYIFDELVGYMKFVFTNLVIDDFTITAAEQVFINFAIVFLKTALPIMCVILVVGLSINFAQVGFAFTLEPLMPNFDKINPLSGFGRLFSKRSLVELSKALFKITIISGFVYRFMVKQTQQIPALINAELIDSFHLTASLILDLVFNISTVLFILAVFDYMYQWWEHQESMKMSKEDIKQEHKQAEGDPQIKGKIKQRQREMAMRRMMQDIPKADVVVTNPTHFAVALQYDQEMLAPIIVAKGQDLIAQKIKEIAKEHRVIIVENKMLARALYAAVEIGHPVPHELYQAVAEVLAYVYKLKKLLL